MQPPDWPPNTRGIGMPGQSSPIRSIFTGSPAASIPCGFTDRRPAGQSCRSSGAGFARSACCRPRVHFRAAAPLGVARRAEPRACNEIGPAAPSGAGLFADWIKDPAASRSLVGRDLAHVDVVFDEAGILVDLGAFLQRRDVDPAETVLARVRHSANKATKLHAGRDTGRIFAVDRNLGP